MIKILSHLFLLILIVLVTGEEEISQQLLEKQRTGCIWLFKKYIAQNKQELDAKMQELTKTQRKQFMDRLLVKAVNNCQKLYNSQSDVEQFVDTYRQSRDIYSFEMINHIERANIDYNEELSEDEIKIIQFSKHIIAAESEEQPYILFGHDLKKLPQSAKTYYLIIYTAVVIFALYHGLKQIEPPRQMEPPHPKRE